MSNITKAIVTITPPVPTGSASANALTPSSMTSLSLNSGLSPHHTALNSPGSLSAATTPMTAGPSSKHCTFALTPITIPPPPNKVSFLSTAKFHSSSNIALATTSAMVAAAAAASKNSATTTTTAATPTNRTPTDISNETMPTPTPSSSASMAMTMPMPLPMMMPKSHSHQKLEMRQSCASQITTVEDVDEICKLSLNDDERNSDNDDEDDDDDDDNDAIGEVETKVLGSGSHRYSNSHSNSSLSSSAAVLTRDKKVIP